MIKKIFLLFLTGALITSCGNSNRSLADEELKSEVELLIDESDTDGDNALSLEELRARYSKAFQILDADGDGDFDSDDYGEPIENMEIFDVDSDGRVMKEDFIKISKGQALAATDISQDNVITEEEALLSHDLDSPSDVDTVVE